MRARLAFGVAVLILGAMAWVESRNRYINTDTGALAVGPTVDRSPPVVHSGTGSSFVMSLESRAVPDRFAPGVQVLTINPDGSSKWKSY